MIKPSSAAITDDVRAGVERINRAGGAYHKYHLADGLVIEGDYDLVRCLRHYNLPRRLDGLSVLDVGTSSGFLAVECARRGAQVTAIDLWEVSVEMQVACVAYGVAVRYVQKSVYDLAAEFGQFDLVLCGSMLLHVSSPVEALRGLRSVCRGRAIVSTTCVPESATSERPVCDFVGVRANDGDYWHYWSIGAEALKRMMLASGFSAIERVDHFVLETEPGRVRHSSPHVIVSATV